MRCKYILLSLFLILVFAQSASAVDLCSQDFGEFGSWSKCTDGTQTRSRTDSTGCIDVETKNCTEYEACHNECLIQGEVLGKCDGTVGERIVCDDYNGNGCLEWGQRIYDYCDIGEVCDKGFCVGKTCEDECELGEQRGICLDDKSSSVKKCGNYDSDICYEWGETISVSCKEDESCKAGLCRQNSEEWICKPWSECVQGTQTRICQDLNSVGTTLQKPLEKQSCLPGLKIFFSPSYSNLILAKSSTEDFSIEIQDKENREAQITWNLNSKPVGNSEALAQKFKENSVLTATIQIENFVQEINWNIEINPQAESSCTPIWSCDWTDCAEEDSFSFAYNCRDISECGVTLNKPEQRECKCVPFWNCSAFEECKIKYSLENVLEKSPLAQGYKERVCVDENGCMPDKILRTICSAPVKIDATKADWCGEDYLEIFDADNNELVSRLKTVSSNSNSLDQLFISFVNSEENPYCDYCFNGIKDPEETEIDCGGNFCPKCVDLSAFENSTNFFLISLWSLFGISCFILIFHEIKIKRK